MIKSNKISAPLILLFSQPVCAMKESLLKSNAGNALESSQMFSIFLVLILMVSAIVIVGFLFKKYSFIGNATNSKIKITAGVHVGTKEKLVLVALGEKQLLLGVTATQISLLHELEEPLEIGENLTKKSANSFSDFLKNAVSRSG